MGIVELQTSRRQSSFPALPHEHVHASVGIVHGAEPREQRHDRNPYHPHPTDALLWRGKIIKWHKK